MVETSSIWSQMGSAVVLAASRASATPAAPSSSPGPFHAARAASQSAASRPGAAAEHSSRVRSTQNRAASARTGSAVIWYIRLNRCARPADP